MSTSLNSANGRINCRPRPPTLPGTAEPIPMTASATFSLALSAARAQESADRLATEPIDAFRKARRLIAVMVELPENEATSDCNRRAHRGLVQAKSADHGGSGRPSLLLCFAEEVEQRVYVRGVTGWSAFPVQPHMRWGIVPGEFAKLPAGLVVGGQASQ